MIGVGMTMKKYLVLTRAVNDWGWYDNEKVSCAHQGRIYLSENTVVFVKYFIIIIII